MISFRNLLIVLGSAWTAGFLAQPGLPQSTIRAYDLDGSHWIDTGDLLKILPHMGQTGDSGADFNGDARTDWKDLYLLCRQWELRAGFANTLPPSPETVADAVDPGAPTRFQESIGFLYSGTDPVQIGIDPGVIDPSRAAVVRGRVLSREGAPLSGVEITIHQGLHYGMTLTREDGRFDLAVNGGGSLTIDYRKEGYLPAQRRVDFRWEDYSIAPDLVMIPLDSAATMIDFSQPLESAQGNPVTDADGTRQATVLFPQNSRPVLVLPGGATQALDSLTFRATEYTVGDNGPLAMPAALPPSSHYTYAVEFSADEALAAGAQSVRFEEPVWFYLENFLGFPIGSGVPTAYYDREHAAWVPLDDGRVIRILGAEGDLAQVDVDGDGLPADGAALTELGITSEERRQLALLYGSGQSLWRVGIDHFSTIDCNWGVSPSSGAEPPSLPEPVQDFACPYNGACYSSGSIIERQNQILGEAIPIAGTGLALHYSSDRVPGRASARTLSIALGETLPVDLRGIEVEVQLAGHTFQYSFPPETGQILEFLWDGRDAYGRMLQGQHPAKIRIGYRYDAYYNYPPPGSRTFGRNSGKPVPSKILARDPVILWQEYLTTIGPWDARGQGFGGWTLNIQHIYDPVRKELLRGDGGRRSVSLMQTIETIAGTGEMFGSYDDGLPATEVAIRFPMRMAVGPDGTLYFPESMGHRVRSVRPDGTTYTVAGTGSLGFSGDGDKATLAKLKAPAGVAVGPDGSLYIADNLNHCIRKVDPSGIITTVAGVGGEKGFEGDEGEATSAKLNSPYDVAMGFDGCLYIADTGNYRVRKVSPDGIIDTLAGNGEKGFGGDKGPATEASFFSPMALAIGPEGNVYIGDVGNYRVRVVEPSGIVRTVAGNGQAGYSGDGGQAIRANLTPDDIALAPGGGLYIVSSNVHRVRLVSPEGVITTVAGSGSTVVGEGGFDGDGGNPTSARLNRPQGIAVAPDGTIYIADTYNYRVRRIRSALPGTDYSGGSIVSLDGRELYEFSSSGRHLATRDALTGETQYSFHYNDQGLLDRVENAFQQTIQIGRGDTTYTIDAPYGQRTFLVLDATGYLTSIVDPQVNKYLFDYSEGGLLETMTDPRLNEWRYEYDVLGRLSQTIDPEGGGLSLERSEFNGGFCVTQTTAEGVVSSSTTERLADGSTRMTHRDSCCGATNEVTVGMDGSTLSNYADGLQTTETEEPDPRFGLQAPIQASRQIVSPGGIVYSLTGNRTVVLEDPSDPMSMTQLTDTLTINGKAFTNAFNASAKQWTQTTPEGRRIVGTVNRVSQPERIEIEGLEDLQMTYDSMGRMTETAFGERQTTLGYDAASGYLTGVTNALKQETRFERDELGRPKKTVLPDQSEIQYAYDSAGNLISLSGPGATAAHRMDYTRTHLLEFYTSPSGATEAFQYDRDKRPVKRTYPSGRSIQWDYSGPNLLTAMRTPEGEHSYVYNPDTRQPERTLSRDGQRIDFGYDGDLLVQADWIGPVTGSVTCEYNSDRRVSNLRYAGLSLPIRYDNDGHVTGVGSIDIARDPSNGKQTSVTDGPFQMGYLYSPYGEIASATASYNGAILYECHYQYDALGRIAGKTECIEDVTHEWTYLYDARGQLTGVSRDGSPVETYSYSLAGNRIGAVNTLTSQNLSESDYEYDADGRLLRAGGTMYTFDADGRLNQVTLSGAPIGYVYNTDGTLAGVDLPTGGRVEYLYDSAGRRIARSLNGVRTHAWLYGQGAAPLAEYDGQGQLRSLFVYASGPAPVRMIRNGETFHLVSDLLGSPRLVVNASGTLVKRIDYDAFGNIIQDTNLAFDLPVGFAAGLADPAQELIRFGARDYQPSTGRWTARDPILAAGGWNLYAYAENSPVSRVDRSGLEDHPACPAQMSEKEEQWYFDHVISQFQGNQADKEYIADIYAAKYLAKAGYHVRGIEGFLITVDKFETALEEDRKKGNKIREAASTHPPTKERLEKVRKYAAEIERFRKELPEYYQKTIHRRINKDVYRQETKDME